MRCPARFALSFSVGVLLVSSTARADPAADRARAAAAFDEGVARFKRADYDTAAHAFDEADRLAPSVIAITNALSAAKRASDHLLVTTLAERAIARGDALFEAREALADAMTRVCRLEIVCDRCALTIDGQPASPPVYVLPGSHVVEAVGSASRERLTCVAGSTQRVDLTRDRGATKDTPPPDRAPAVEAAIPASRPLSPAFFFVGLGVTAVLTGVTVWSGLDAIASKSALPAAPTQAEEDDVRSRARRTDYLLLGAGLAAAGSVVLGVFTFRSSGSSSGKGAAASRLWFTAAPRGMLVGTSFR